eukprot:1650380-Amphidinium_carterae.2
MAARMASVTSWLRRTLRCSSDSCVVVGSMISTEKREATVAFVLPRLSESERLPSGASSGSGSPAGAGSTRTSPCVEE